MVRTREVKAFAGDVMVLNQGFGSGRDALRAGERVKVLGLPSIAYGRTSNHGMAPGIYVNPMWAEVEGAGGARRMLSVGYLDHVDGATSREVDASFLRRGDLPETPFWETDAVSGPDGKRMTVEHVDYLALEPGDGIPEAPYACRLEDGGTRRHAAADLTLVERGPIWRRAHGEAVAFPDLEAESAFHVLVGETAEVRRPDGKGFAFDPDEAREALREGLAHGIHGGLGKPFPESGGTAHLVRYRDAGLGERVRQATLEALDETPAPGR